MATRSGQWWFLEVTGLDRACTQAPRLSEADEMARDLIAIHTDAPEDSFSITLRPGRVG